MVTKFVNRLRTFFNGPPEVKDNTADWIPDRVADLKRRIAEVKRSQGWNENANHRIKKPEPQINPVEQKRDLEMNALKAKLMGKK